MNEEIIDDIESKTQENVTETEVKHMTTWLLFSISDI